MTLMTKSEFAAHIGKNPGYVSQLSNNGRLVMQGKMVNVEASVLRIAETADPGKVGVVVRHQIEREQKQNTSHELDELSGKLGHQYQNARAQKEKYAALQAKLAFEKEIGLLLVANEAKMAVADGDVIIRNKLEAMPDILAPQLAAVQDENRIRAILIDYVEQLLGDISRTFNGLVKK